MGRFRNIFFLSVCSGCLSCSGVYTLSIWGSHVNLFSFLFPHFFLPSASLFFSCDIFLSYIWGLLFFAFLLQDGKNTWNGVGFFLGFIFVWGPGGNTAFA